MTTSFRYYKKKERLERYMIAAAEGNTDGLLSPRQAVDAYYDFMKAWGEFTRAQKLRYKQMRFEERVAMGRGEPPPVHDYTSGVNDDVKFWEEALADAKNKVRRR